MLKKCLMIGLALFVCFMFFGSDELISREISGDTGVFVVNDPKDLSLTDLGEGYSEIVETLKGKGIIGKARTAALSLKMRSIGMGNPAKNPLHVGYVFNNGAQRSSLIMVTKGNINKKKMDRFLSKEYKKYSKRENRIAEEYKGKPIVSKTSQITIEGCSATSFAYVERPYEVIYGGVDDYYLIAAVPKNDHSLLKKTLKVLKGEIPLNQNLPDMVQASTKFSMTKREARNIEYVNTDKRSLKSKVNKQCKKVFSHLGIDVTDKKLAPLKDKIRAQLIKSDSVDILYEYKRDSDKKSTYMVQYTVDFKDDAAAKNMKSLIVEKIVDIAENASGDSIADDYNKLTVFTEGNSLLLQCELDGKEAQFSMLSSMSGKIMEYSFLDTLLESK
ncbi:hypothetical protein KAJ27_20460 [bacterium]|nr:hypothetical protein [bacterium]